jgi:hypothetical protein
MTTARGRLLALLHHPTVNLAVAIALVATSLAEIWKGIAGKSLTMAIGAVRMDVGVSDGVLLYGLVHLARAIAELLQSLEARAAAARGG